MPGINTNVAQVQRTSMSGMCAPTSSLLTGLGGNGSLSSETVSVLIFEMGQEATNRDTDDQGCAFRARQSLDRGRDLLHCNRIGANSG